MKTLYLVRHAKSSRDDPTLADRDRPLNDRGLDDAPEIGKRLAKRRVDPDLIVSSPAARALKTAQLIAAEIGYECANIVIEERLYAAPVDDLLSVIRATDKKVDRLMLCGHNPEFSDLATHLAGEPIDMPTCAVAEFAYDDARWSDVGTVKPSRTGLEKPKK